MILLVTIVIPAYSNCTKSAMTSDLMFLRALLRLVIWELNDSINFVLLSLLIRIMTCFLKGSFIVIFNLGLELPSLLMIFWIFSIFFAYNFRNISLILRISLVVVDEDKIYIYDFLAFFFLTSWLFFLKNLKISLTSLGDFAGISGVSGVQYEVHI